MVFRATLWILCTGYINRQGPLFKNYSKQPKQSINPSTLPMSVVHRVTSQFSCPRSQSCLQERYCYSHLGQFIFRLIGRAWEGTQFSEGRPALSIRRQLRHLLKLPHTALQIQEGFQVPCLCCMVARLFLSARRSGTLSHFYLKQFDLPPKKRPKSFNNRTSPQALFPPASGLCFSPFLHRGGLPSVPAPSHTNAHSPGCTWHLAAISSLILVRSWS